MQFNDIRFLCSTKLVVPIIGTVCSSTCKTMQFALNANTVCCHSSKIVVISCLVTKQFSLNIVLFSLHFVWSDFNSGSPRIWDIAFHSLNGWRYLAGFFAHGVCFSDGQIQCRQCKFLFTILCFFYCYWQ